MPQTSTLLPAQRRLLTANECADQLGLSVQRVYELARLGLLPSVRFGRSVRFAQAALDDFIASGGQALSGGWRRLDGV
jgi:excisionase family DNA binding protein